MFFDYNDCPMCGPAFLEQDHTIAESEGLLLTRPIDRLFMRIVPEDVNFQLGFIEH